MVWTTYISGLTTWLSVVAVLISLPEPSTAVDFGGTCDNSTSLCDTVKDLECADLPGGTKLCKCVVNTYYNGGTCKNNAIANLQVINPGASAVSQTQLLVTWTSPTHSSSIDRIEVSTSGIQPVTVNKPLTTQATLTGLTAGTQYTITITSIDTTSRLTEQSTSVTTTGTTEMPKEQNNKVYKPYSGDNFEKAIESVKAGMSQRQAAKKYGIPQATLSDHLCGRVQDGVSAGRKPVFPTKVETLIAEKCSKAAEMGLGMTRLQVMKKAGQLAKQMKIKTNFKNNMPGKDWWTGFRKRNRNITLRAPEKLTSVRARGLNPEKVGEYLFDLLNLISEAGLENHPECIWNMDEKGVSMEHDPSRVVAFKGSRAVPGRVCNTRESNTFIACINAKGQSLSPLIIVKGKTEKSLWGYNTAMGPPRAHWTYQQNAWTEGILGVEWFCNIFLKECGEHRPQILILDGHHSHEVLGLIEAASKNNIHIMALPHTTHYLCPLDRYVFGPFSTHYNTICSEFNQNPLNVINKMSWPGLFNTAYMKSFTPENIESGFQVCSILPWNPLIIPAEAFAPSFPTDSLNTSGNHPLQWVVSKVITRPSDNTSISDNFECVADDGPGQSSGANDVNRLEDTCTTSSESICVSDTSLTLDKSPFMTEQSHAVLLPVDTEEREAVESLLALESSFDKSEDVVLDISITSSSSILDLPLAINIQEDDQSKADFPLTMADWNQSVENMFTVTIPAVKKPKSKKVTSHRLLTSENI